MFKIKNPVLKARSFLSPGKETIVLGKAYGLFQEIIQDFFLKSKRQPTPARLGMECVRLRRDTSSEVLRTGGTVVDSCLVGKEYKLNWKETSFTTSHPPPLRFRESPGFPQALQER